MARRELRAECPHAIHALGDDERCARFQPIHAGPPRRCAVSGAWDGGKIEGNLTMVFMESARLPRRAIPSRQRHSGERSIETVRPARFTLRGFSPPCSIARLENAYDALLYGIADLGYVAAADACAVPNGCGRWTCPASRQGRERGGDWRSGPNLKVAEPAGVPLIINDHPHLVPSIGAQGAHVADDSPWPTRVLAGGTRARR